MPDHAGLGLRMGTRFRRSGGREREQTLTQRLRHLSQTSRPETRYQVAGPMPGASNPGIPADRAGHVVARPTLRDICPGAFLSGAVRPLPRRAGRAPPFLFRSCGPIPARPWPPPRHGSPSPFRTHVRNGGCRPVSTMRPAAASLPAMLGSMSRPNFTFWASVRWRPKRRQFPPSVHIWYTLPRIR